MKIHTKLLGSMTLGVLTFTPVVLWLMHAGFGSITSSLGTFIASLGKAVALSGIAMYALMPVLSMRHRLLEKMFGGLDNVYQLHKSAGKKSVVLITLHPLLLGLGRYMDGDSFSGIWDWSSFVVLLGIAAIIVMIIVTVVSIYSHIRHQNWIWVHRVFGWLIPVFFAHALFARGQITQNPLLLGYMLTLASAGFAAFAYRSVFSKYLNKKYEYVVSDINKFTDSVVEVVLKPLGVPIGFTPGQFAFVSFASDAVDAEAHPFSFSNANNGPYVRFTVKALGDDTSKFKDIKTGDKAFLEGPYGQFSYRRVKNRKQVWIAGGVGITPFLSMARSLSGNKTYDINFFYGTESLEDAVFLQEFIDITRHLPDNFNTTVVSKDMSGFVSADLIKKSIQNLDEYDYMICGPPGMMKAIQMQLKDAGVPQDQVHVEAFSV